MKDHPFVSVIIPTYRRKEKLNRLIYSIFESDYSNVGKFEVIVVVDADGENYDDLTKMFSKVNFIFNETEKFLAETRNVGIKHSKGRYIFLVDDDNIVDKKCISELVNFMEIYPDVGVAGPIMYYLRDPQKIWCAGVKRNYYTSLTKFIGRNEIRTGLIFTPVTSEDFPNAFMIKREVIEKIGLFDSKNFPIHYDEADFCKRVSNVGYKICMVPGASVWHDIPLPEKLSDASRLFHVHDMHRAYYVGRNRLLFHKKYSGSFDYLVFLMVFNWLITLYYLQIFLLQSRRPFEERVKIAKKYLRGVLDGLRWKKFC